MIRRMQELAEQTRENIRGGLGRATCHEYLGRDDMAGVQAMSVLTLEPGASIGEHLHIDTEELYYIVAGSGTGSLDGESSPVGPGDAWVVRAGHTHGLRSGSVTPLVFLALLTRVPVPS